MFEKATRLKLRFSTSKGNLSVEDLWDLSLAQLNVEAKRLNKDIKNIEEEDFLEDVTAEDTIVKLKFAIVLHILTIKKDENKAKQNAALKKAKKAKLAEILERKQDASFENLSEEEIKKMIAELD